MLAYINNCHNHKRRKTRNLGGPKQLTRVKFSPLNSVIVLTSFALAEQIEILHANLVNLLILHAPYFGNIT